MSGQSRIRRVINIFVVLLIFAACLGGYLWYSGFFSVSPTKAVVHDGEGLVYELPLDTDAELTVSTSLGINVIKVQDGAVWVEYADCPNQDCVLMGKISTPVEQIVCLAHELWIEIVREDTQSVESADSYDSLSR